MGYNLPEGNNHFLDNTDMICEKCDCKDDVDNGEYVNHQWYCNSCYKELFKKCPRCGVIIPIDEELCEDCLEEKTYFESAEGMFEKEGYKKIQSLFNNIIIYANDNSRISFDTRAYSIRAYRTVENQYLILPLLISLNLHKAINQQTKELGW